MTGDRRIRLNQTEIETIRDALRKYEGSGRLAWRFDELARGGHVKSWGRLKER